MSSFRNCCPSDTTTAIAYDDDCERPQEKSERTKRSFECPEDEYAVDSCVAQASRKDMDRSPCGPGTVEHVWIMSRPPRMHRGVSPTVTARRAYVTLTHVQGRVLDPAQVSCKKVCSTTTDNEDGGKDEAVGGSQKRLQQGAASCTRGSRSCNK